jgi:hypothetical protein
MPDRYDEDTDTWDIDTGVCPYCDETLYENVELKYSNRLKVKDHDRNKIHCEL